MAESAFEKFPARFKPLIEKLPPRDESGLTVLEGNWWRRDRDEIARSVALLGRRLQGIERGLQKSRRAGDLDATRGRVACALQEMQQALLQVYGADTLWPLSVAIEVFEYAGDNKRHWLTALRRDGLHDRRGAPKRLSRQAMAAATVEYFENRLDETQESIAGRVADAMGEGGFRVSSKGKRTPPTARTVQDWRNKYQPGKRPRRKAVSSDARRVYVAVLGVLEREGKSWDPVAFFEAWLSDITEYCWSAAEIRRS